MFFVNHQALMRPVLRRPRPIPDPFPAPVPEPFPKPGSEPFPPSGN